MVWSHMSVDLTPHYMVWKKIEIECVGSSWWCLAGVQSGPAAVPTPPCSGGCRQSGHAITTTLQHQHSLYRNFTQDPQIFLVLLTRFIIHHALSTWDKLSKMVYVRWQCLVVSLSPPELLIFRYIAQNQETEWKNLQRFSRLVFILKIKYNENWLQRWVLLFCWSHR